MIPHRGGLPHSDIHGSKPARGSPWLFAACHVLHRLLVPRHPPNALIMLDTIRQSCNHLTHHARKPSTESRRERIVIVTVLQLAQHTTGFYPPRPRSRAGKTDKTFLTPLNTRSPTGGRRPERRLIRSDVQPDHGTPTQAPITRSAPKRHHTRPQTHQNLIYPDKEQQHRRPRIAPKARSTAPAGGSSEPQANTELLASL